MENTEKLKAYLVKNWSSEGIANLAARPGNYNNVISAWHLTQMEARKAAILALSELTGE